MNQTAININSMLKFIKSKHIVVLFIFRICMYFFNSGFSRWLQMIEQYRKMSVYLCALTHPKAFTKLCFSTTASAYLDVSYKEFQSLFVHPCCSAGRRSTCYILICKLYSVPRTHFIYPLLIQQTEMHTMEQFPSC